MRELIPQEFFVILFLQNITKLKNLWNFQQKYFEIQNELLFTTPLYHCHLFSNCKWEIMNLKVDSRYQDNLKKHNSMKFTKKVLQTYWKFESWKSKFAEHSHSWPPSSLFVLWTTYLEIIYFSTFPPNKNALQNDCLHFLA